MRKLLIANRGEIAVRIMRTARMMGIATVAVYSDADADALHVRQADEAVRLGLAAADQSYLVIDKVIAAAKATGADAIHPGYGFLSENPEFVEAVEAAGLVFVGPSADAIRKMGLKDAAKALMEAADVPVVPGYHGADQDDATLARAAADIGYPVLIKAVAGGGGKGMRIVEGADAFAAALDSARNEARAAFGNADVLIEKYLSQSRHIEVQVFGDGTDAVHLFERDCSLQRRHQKVIEEAPAPDVPQKMRDAMGAAAVRAAQAIGYKGAGTVEFIVDASGPLRDDGFYFMEMNTRLQVEHPVTEAVCGVDLVAWQLRVASGAPLPATQSALSLNGHAIEVRVYAEDVPAGFLPATGRLEHLVVPQETRWDAGVEQGDAVGAYYDPMIAKLVVHGTDRADALARMAQALDGLQIAGLTTNVGFLRRLIAVDGFQSGQVHTGLIEAHLEALTQRPDPCSRSIALAAVSLAGPHGDGFALWQPLTWDVTLAVNGTHHVVRLTPDTAGWQVDVAGRVHLVNGREIDGQVVPATVVQLENRVSVFWGNDYVFERVDPLDRTVQVAAGDSVAAPMPGVVRALDVAVGDPVRAGARVAVLEAMKMEQALVAPRDGVVAQVNAAVGGQVAAGDVLVALDVPEAAE
ncbi:biotin carboxylase N-terminal domain-containing protein [Nereida sp. MMG025]|uniref:acetyl/propionyl/methylcrotonyl-CoA carboxylase subunit alpha n=1 Tax=Nereida sp. MMG025 TaxID=2909981 RepID=UPI001F1E23D2|nr:biotin carboxylase N-terminal domain-containing protein [Nereida sp. MMG025]MCF6445285.1 ATP-grasp domain-containing protein [Nereida sp. MMG025]